MSGQQHLSLPSKKLKPEEMGGLQSLDQRAFDIFISLCHVELVRSQPCSAVSPEYLRRRCYDRWRDIDEDDRRPFYRMLQEDENQNNKEGLVNNESDNNTEREEYKSAKTHGKRRKKRDPDYQGPSSFPSSPLPKKRAVSGYFLFCNEERARMKKEGLRVGPRELGRR